MSGERAPAGVCGDKHVLRRVEAAPAWQPTCGSFDVEAHGRNPEVSVVRYCDQPATVQYLTQWCGEGQEFAWWRCDRHRWPDDPTPEQQRRVAAQGGDQ